jgi:hypothetical protein
MVEARGGVSTFREDGALQSTESMGGGQDYSPLNLYSFSCFPR